MSGQHSGFDAEQVKPVLPLLHSLPSKLDMDENQRKALDSLLAFLSPMCEEKQELMPPGSVESEIFQDYLSSYLTPSMPASMSRGSTMGRTESIEPSSWDGLMKEIRVHRAALKWKEKASQSQYKRSTAIQEQLRLLGSWEKFDIFQMAELSQGKPLEHTCLALVHALGLGSKFNINMTTLCNFLEAIETAYCKTNPYHNATHAADVVQGVACVLLTDKDFAAQLTDLETLALIMAALIHDVGHPGVTNAFHVTTSSGPAYVYNDNSVNENSHLSVAFQILRQPENNFLAGLPDSDFRFIRALIINIVLSTDMSFHQSMVKSFPATIQLHGTNISTWGAEPRAQLLKFVLHAVDIANPGRPWRHCVEWGRRVNYENFMQGDKEAEVGVPISPLNDKAKANVVKGQQVFCDLFAKPTFAILAPLAPLLAATVTKHCEENSAKYQAMLDKGEVLLPGMAEMIEKMEAVRLGTEEPIWWSGPKPLRSSGSGLSSLSLQGGSSMEGALSGSYTYSPAPSPRMSVTMSIPDAEASAFSEALLPTPQEASPMPPNAAGAQAAEPSAASQVASGAEAQAQSQQS